MPVRYEWSVETVTTDEHNEVEDIDHRNSYAEVLAISKRTPPDGHRFDVGLVRDDDNGRSWAYIEDDKLPEHFLDAYDRIVAKVPVTFYREVEKAHGRMRLSYNGRGPII